MGRPSVRLFSGPPGPSGADSVGASFTLTPSSICWAPCCDSSSPGLCALATSQVSMFSLLEGWVSYPATSTSVFEIALLSLCLPLALSFSVSL